MVKQVALYVVVGCCVPIAMTLARLKRRAVSAEGSGLIGTAACAQQHPSAAPGIGGAAATAVAQQDMQQGRSKQPQASSQPGLMCRGVAYGKHAGRPWHSMQLWAHSGLAAGIIDKWENAASWYWKAEEYLLSLPTMDYAVLVCLICGGLLVHSCFVAMLTAVAAASSSVDMLQHTGTIWEHFTVVLASCMLGAVKPEVLNLLLSAKVILTAFPSSQL